jgi:hypothetical protein
MGERVFLGGGSLTERQVRDEFRQLGEAARLDAFETLVRFAAASERGGRIVEPALEADEVFEKLAGGRYVPAALRIAGGARLLVGLDVWTGQIRCLGIVREARSTAVLREELFRRCCTVFQLSHPIREPLVE